MALGPIPFTAIVDYYNIFDLSDFEEFHYVIRRMDKVYLELNNKDVSSGSSKGGAKSNVNSNKKNTHKS